ncbi:MAG TPA: acetyl-CoA C-acyltransferase, partial [Steroidobacteraceae bacterium]|nr:acetyl-CoA C-acyltransferase [Steroidobacteraceae bacterium]
MSEPFICDAARTPIGRYGGALAAVRADDLAAVPIAALLRRNPSLEPAAIEEVLLGCANQAGEDNRNVARMAALLAGLPVSVPGATINRLCGSGLDAVAMAARIIRTGEAEVVVAGGVESMSRAPFVIPKADAAFSRSAEIHDTTLGWRFVNPRMRERYGIDSMPETGENVAAQFNIARADQDRFALRSQQRTAAAYARGFYEAELVPVEIAQRKGKALVVTRDEHPRPETTLEQLAALPTPFRTNGTVTAGNASGVNDGAAALLIASAEAAAKHGLTPRARVLGMASAA